MGIQFDDEAPEKPGSGSVVFDDEQGPKWSDLPSHIIPNATEIGKSSINTAGRIMKGVNDIPEDAVETVKQELQGKSPLDSPIAQDVKTVGKGVLDTAKSIPKSLADLVSKEAWVNRPVSNALTAGSIVAPFIGGGEAAELPKDVVPPEAAAAAEAPKGLPVMEPQAKTGDPHALFAYNDNFGPEGAPRSVYNIFGDPNNPTIKAAGGHGSSVPKEILDQHGIPIVGREPRSVGKWEPIEGTPPVVPIEGAKGPAGEPPSRMPPDPNAPPPKTPPPPPAPADPLKDVKDYINSKYGAASAKPGFSTKVANYLQEEANKLGGKDIGLQGRQIQGMGQGFKGLEKANSLIDYAREKGYLDPGLTDVARRGKIAAAMDKSGKVMNAIRATADTRAAAPVESIKAAVKQELEAKYGSGTEKATSEVANVMDEINKAKPTFTGMSELATKLNKSATQVQKLSQHPGPTTDAANIVSRINNDAIRATLNPKEAELYTHSLRDYGANKKLEQTTAAAGRRDLVARSNQRGILGRAWQEALDRGGYRIAGNVASRMAKAIKTNPGGIRSLPQFFEELAHHSDDVIDDTIQGMSKGGMVPQEVKDYVKSRSC